MAGIKRKIFLIALGISLTTLVAFCAAAFWGLYSLQAQMQESSKKLGEFAAENSNLFLERGILDKMMAEARDQSLIINERLLSISKDVQYFSNFVTEIYQHSEGLPAITIPYSSSENYGKLTMQLKSANGQADYPHIKEEAELLGNISASFKSNKDDMESMTVEIFLGTESGFFISYDPYSNTQNQIFDPRTRPWYIGAKREGSIFWTSPYIGAANSRAVITCAQPFYNLKNEFSGVVGIDVLIDDLHSEIVNINTSEGGFALITDSNGILISSSIKDISEVLFSNAIKEVIPGTRGYTRILTEGTEMFLVYSPIETTNWSLVILQPVSEIMENVQENSRAIEIMTQETREYVNNIIRFTVFIFAGMFIVAAIAVAVFSSKLSARIARPIDILEAELNVAANIQTSMLPNIFPPFPGIKEFDIYAFMQPAKEVGGDFYDFFMINKNTLGVVIADVSGKGVPAALFMVISKTLIKDNALSGKSPKDCFISVNNLLCENNDACMFVTAFMGFLDLITGKLTYVNAGHNPPLLKRTDSGFDWLAVKPGFVLAAMEDIQYEQNEIIMNKGDTLFLYTDGVTEAFNNKSEQFSEERLMESVNKNNTKDIIGFINGIKEDIDLFANGAQQADDITMLILNYKEQAK